MKYIDLANSVKRGHGDDEVRKGIDYALNWLDRHSERVPGRTITESERNDWTSHMTMGGLGGFDEALERLGITVVPDPEPTNAERLEALLRAADEANADQEFSRFARWLDESGVKAPEAGGNDAGWRKP